MNLFFLETLQLNLSEQIANNEKNLESLKIEYECKINLLNTEINNLNSNKSDKEKELLQKIENIFNELNLKNECINSLEKELEQIKLDSTEKEIKFQDLTLSNEELITQLQKAKEEFVLNEQEQKIKLENLQNELKISDEKLKNAQIDITCLQEKLNESLKDYRGSIEKLQLASKQRLLKMKKKLANSSLVLSLIEKNLFDQEDHDSSSNLLFTQFINNLNQSESSKKPTTESNMSDSQSSISIEEVVNFEFDETKFRELIENKKAQFQRLKESESFKIEIKNLNDELEAFKLKFNKAEIKFKVKNDF